MQGNVFEWWYQFFVSTPKENCIDTKNTFEKQLIYLDYMTSIVDTISLMCPIPTSFEKSNGLSDSMSKKLIDKLTEMKWKDIFQDIITSIETEGDKFFQICYDSEKKDYYLLSLESKYMVQIKKDKKGNKNLYYKYEKPMVESELDKQSGTFSDIKYTDTYIFTEGGYYFYSGLKPSENPTFISNTDLMGNIIPIVHIPSLTASKEWTGFSNIPAVSYFDTLNVLITADTDRRLINRLAGYPRTYIIDGKINAPTSSLDAGGYVDVRTREDANPNDLYNSKRVQAQVKQLEINNGMSSINEERKDIVDMLFNLAGLMRPKLEERMGASDSSKAIAQFRIKQEAKNKKYLENIREAMSIFFGLIVKNLETSTKNKYIKKSSNKNVNSSFKKIYLQVPSIVITTSVFDHISLLTQEMSIGVKSLREALREAGWSNSQISEHEKEIQNEVFQESGKDVNIITPLDGKQQKLSNNIRQNNSQEE